MIRTWMRFACLVTLGVALSGCVGSFPLMVSGFKPERPAPTYAERFPMVDSLKPTLVWSAFPGTDYPVPFSKPKVFVDESIGATNVRYDLIIWKPINPKYVFYGGWGKAFPSPGKAWGGVDTMSVVYERNGLTNTSHTVEDALEPGVEYAWSVRARFDVNGQTRISEWSLVVIPFPGGEGALPELWSRGIARQTGDLPSFALYYFVTPQVITELGPR